jgi:site-specific recombinase XerD
LDVPSPRHAHVRFDPPNLPALEAERERYKTAGLAPRTISSYAADVRVFRAWTAASGLVALPATQETVELYVTDLLRRGRKVTTAERHCFAIHREHTAAGVQSPYGAELKKLLSGARRMLCQLPNQKAAIEPGDLRAIVRTIGNKRPITARNCALMIFGYATALRRSTLAALRVEDIEFTRDGYIVTIRHEKQDRKGDGRLIAVPFGKRKTTCPVRILRHWLELRGDGPGALFCCVMRGCATGKHLHGNRIAQIVQEAVESIGLDPRRYGAHSMRAGFVSEALANGASQIAVARQTGHASMETLRIYARGRNLFRGNAAGMLGL